jgi:hypothetical protein
MIYIIDFLYDIYIVIMKKNSFTAVSQQFHSPRAEVPSVFHCGARLASKLVKAKSAKPIKKKKNNSKNLVFSAADIKTAKRIIFCPHGERHIDKGKFANRPQTEHLCVHEIKVWDAKKGKFVTKKKREFFTVKEPSIGV